MKRYLPAILLVLLAGGVAAWYWQSQLIGHAGSWYLGHIAASENQTGSVAKRRDILAQQSAGLGAVVDEQRERCAPRQRLDAQCAGACLLYTSPSPRDRG